ncbi:MAG TPA: hypothetical protein VGR00_10075 [Thermoanaerobaculia bacterium]|nr:hypothetical protein [Thermoanaerobaculia bacterium]
MPTATRARRIALALLALATIPLAAQPVGPEFRVNTFTTNQQKYGNAASDAEGDFVVVWTSYGADGNHFGVSAQRYDSAGTARGAEFRVNSYTTHAQYVAQQRRAVAMDPSGNFVVVWTSDTQDGSFYGVFGQRFASAGGPVGAEFRVNTYTTSRQSEPTVAMDGAGRFVVVWADDAQEGASLGVFGQRYDAAGTPSGPAFRVNSYTTSDQYNPCVAADPAGDFVVVWTSDGEDGDSFGIFGQRLASGGAPLGPEFRVNTYTTGTQSRAAVGSSGTGSFIVMWESSSQDAGTFGVFAQRYASTGTPVGSEFRVNSYTTNGQFFPSLAFDSDGNFAVVWSSLTQDGSNYGVFGRRYGSAGAPLGAEFRVNATTSSRQDFPSVTSDPTGKFVVSWTSVSQDGSSDGIFAQRFCLSLSSVSVTVAGSTTVTVCSTGGTASVADVGGGGKTHQWGYRNTSGGFIFNLAGETGTSYLIDGADFTNPGLPGIYYLVCVTFPECGTSLVSNEVLVNLQGDTLAPAVTPPSSATVTQTLCQ